MSVKLSVRLLVAGVVLALATSLPALAQEAGTVTGEVTVQEAPEACILVSANHMDFGVLDFGQFELGPEYAVSSCASSEQHFLIRGTHATGPAATWFLQAPPSDVNGYALDLHVSVDGGSLAYGWITTTNQLALPSIQPAAARRVDHALRMPTPGSDGAGTVMTFDVIWTAVLGAGIASADLEVQEGGLSREDLQ
jgi:hypothetical protein